MYSRALEQTLLGKMGKGKAIIITGPRQVGKTTLLQTVLQQTDHLFFDGDDPSVRDILTNPNLEQLRTIIGNHTVVFIDEAQRIPNIGVTMKLVTDRMKNVQLLVSGSSSFDLSNNLNEPLTGRKWEYVMLPISWAEFEAKEGYLKAQQQLENRLIYGFYPDVLNNTGSERELLVQLTNSYLCRDILAFSGIKKPDVLEKLLQALALQLGSEVSYNELAQTVGLDKNTVGKYIDILCKGYILFKLGSFSRNLRNEIKFNQKIYFYDNGVRNMLIGNFNNLSLRLDTGALWENFLVSERQKHNLYAGNYAKPYFWRTTQQQEIDYIEDKDGALTAYEFKWKARKQTKIPTLFTSTYQAGSMIVDATNFREFISPKEG
jgi:predicted AAA+ superfamily ATPase